jgi:SNF2 family DNA or RNA helicase
MGDIIRRHLQETFAREVLFLHGGTPRKRRDEMVQRFQSADGPPVFLLSLEAGGTGLNLTAATHVFHFDRWSSHENSSRIGVPFVARPSTLAGTPASGRRRAARA